MSSRGWWTQPATIEHPARGRKPCVAGATEATAARARRVIRNRTLRSEFAQIGLSGSGRAAQSLSTKNMNALMSVRPATALAIAARMYAAS